MKINPRKPVSMTTIRQLNERKVDQIIQTYIFTTSNKATQTDALQNKETQTNCNHSNEEKK